MNTAANLDWRPEIWWYYWSIKSI